MRTPRPSPYGFARSLGPAVCIGLAAWTAVDARPLSGAQIAQHGSVANGTPACQSCHGGAGTPSIDARTPRIAGLDAAYLQRQLQLFATGQRRNLAMMQAARSLSADNREAVAAYFAGLPAGTPSPTAVSRPVDTAAGRRLAERGRWAANIPPCASCHAADGLGVGATSPALAGQSAAYIEAQLVDWSSGARSGDPLGLMTGIARRLRPEDRKNVAAYYASLRTRPVTAPSVAKARR